MWHKIDALKGDPHAGITAVTSVSADSHWFHGHFPGEPILPGVAQIGMVLDAINQAVKPEMTITSIRRVRFKQIIRPDDQLQILATPVPHQSDAYAFRINVMDELVCSGIVSVVQRVVQ